MGADKVISVDLQRPGQGHEACFFTNTLPAETITTSDLFLTHFHETLDSSPLVIVSPNTELVKKARKLQQQLQSLRPQQDITAAVFLRSDADISFTKGAPLEMQGDVRGKDVILIEDYIDSALHISILCNRLLKEGANKVTICASHGLFDETSVNLIDISPVSQVIITDSIALPKQSSSKIVQLSIAQLIAGVIQSDISHTTLLSEFNTEENDDDFIQE